MTGHAMKGLALAAGLASLSAAGAAAQTLEVGANIGNVPWEFENENGEFVGFEIDLVTEIADRLGYEAVDINNIPFNGLFAAVRSGRIDVATSSITITEERLENVSFAQPYYDSDQSLTGRADSDIETLEDLEGATVGVDTGSTGDIWTSEHAEELAIGEIRRYEGLQPAMLDLAGGRLDAYISDIPALLYYTKDKPDLEVKQRIETGERYSMMFAKDSELTAQFNEVITELKEEGYIAEIHEKWFGSAPDAGTSTVELRDMPETR